MYVSHLYEHRRLQRLTGRAQAASETLMQPTNAGEPTTPLPESQDGQVVDDRRRWDRVSAGGEVIVRRLGGFNFQVALHDLSAGGCRVEMIEPSEAGDNVITRLPQLEPLGSTVCWADGTTAGIKFSTPIHPAVLDLVVSRLDEQPAA